MNTGCDALKSKSLGRTRNWLEKASYFVSLSAWAFLCWDLTVLLRENAATKKLERKKKKIKATSVIVASLTRFMF